MSNVGSSFGCALLLLAAAAGAGAAQEIEQEEGAVATGVGASAKASLEFRMAAAGERAPVSTRPYVCELAAAPIESELALPQLRCPDPRFGYLRLGRTGRVNFVLDKSDSERRFYDLLHVDFDQNGDFTNDGAPLSGVHRFVPERGLDYVEFTAVKLHLQFGPKAETDYAFTLYAWYPRSGPLERVMMTSASWREGAATIEGKPVRLAVFDDDNDGQFDVESCRWSLVEDGADPKQLLDPARIVPCFVPLRVANIPYRIRGLMPDGGLADLESETELDTRKAQLTFDPDLTEASRPRAAAPPSFGSDLNLAASVAKAEGKRVFAVVTVGWTTSARRFEQRTLLDAEVCRLLEEYVCVRVDADLAPAVAEHYQVAAYPTTLILDGDGQVQERAVGYRPARQLSELLLRSR